MVLDSETYRTERTLPRRILEGGGKCELSLFAQSPSGRAEGPLQSAYGCSKSLEIFLQSRTGRISLVIHSGA
jgi:hypothetical protein